MKYSKISIIYTPIIRGFWDQNLVRPSTADNRGLTVSGFGQESASEKSPFYNLLSELIYLKLKRYGWRQVIHGNRL